MKHAGRVLSLILVISLIVSMTVLFAACGKSDKDTGTDTSIGSSADTSSQNVADSSSADASAEEEDTTPKPDSSLSGDSILGEWVMVDDSSKFANVTKTDSGYKYVDNDGTYTGAYANGKLTVKVEADNSEAEIFYDAKAKNLVVLYMGGVFTFTKKQ